MGLQSSDIILVERSSTLYRETYGNRANIDSSDLLLVDRGGTLYKCAYSDWPNANSSDLILVERGAGAGELCTKKLNLTGRHLVTWTFIAQIIWLR